MPLPLGVSALSGSHKVRRRKTFAKKSENRRIEMKRLSLIFITCVFLAAAAARKTQVMKIRERRFISILLFSDFFAKVLRLRTLCEPLRAETPSGKGIAEFLIQIQRIPINLRIFLRFLLSFLKLLFQQPAAIFE